MLLGGFIVLAVGIVLGSVFDQIVGSYPHGTPQPLEDLAVVSLIISYIFGFAGVILIIYGFTSKDPPVHWNNNL